ncbi:hypothetical protein [Alteromonas stellipolaris]|uniref:Uncharacterized protein n=1 Tax=Alteromonas stellipolaris TaxID=233316 RepID=A0ABN4LTM2_9ALTE|nr:hypothetical protein AVL57_00225 [Alteromonas stellipolaris]
MSTKRKEAFDIPGINNQLCALGFSLGIDYNNDDALSVIEQRGQSTGICTFYVGEQCYWVAPHSYKLDVDTVYSFNSSLWKIRAQVKESPYHVFENTKVKRDLQKQVRPNRRVMDVNQKAQKALLRDVQGTQFIYVYSSSLVGNFDITLLGESVTNAHTLKEYFNIDSHGQ